MSNVLTVQANESLLSSLKNDPSLTMVKPTNPYITVCYKGDGITISIYTSHKIVFQGNRLDYWLDHFNIHASNPVPSSTSSTYPQAGSDEVGTGDVFGPVVVAATYVDRSMVDRLKALNIDDSKLMDDQTIRTVAPIIMDLIPYSVLILDDAKYNQMHQIYNLNALKAILHNHAYIKLQEKINTLPKLCVVDQFTPESTYYRYIADQPTIIRGLTFHTKAEHRFLAVACASVIARYTFLNAMDQLSAQLGIQLHKGAGKLVDEDIRLIHAQYGQAMLYHVAKLHFSNIQKVNDHA